MEKNNLTIDNPLIQSKLLIFDKKIEEATSLLMKYNLFSEAFEMLKGLQKWEKCIQISEEFGHPQTEKIKNQYFEYLIKTQQFDKAAKFKLIEENYIEAINLYLKGGYPVQASNLYIK